MIYNKGAYYNKHEKYNDSTPTNFKEIDNPKDMIRYLSDSRRRLENSDYIFHYTSFDVVINILRRKEWHLGSAVFMNDRLEYENGDPSIWPNIFFSSLMTEDDESIGMWSMYAQPWHLGVKITIPSKKAREWINGVRIIKEIDQESKLATGRVITVDKDIKLNLSSVTYCNTDRVKIEDSMEKLTWSNVVNTNFQGAAHMHELTGYVKDLAWSYEKEIRILAKFDNTQNFKRIALDIPDEIIGEMIFTASPVFGGDLRNMVYDELDIEIKTEKSLFEDKLAVSSICDRCDLRQADNKRKKQHAAHS